MFTSPRLLIAQFLVKKIRRFERDESGALIIFTLILFFLMVMMGGVAVDVMRYETIRTELQNTLDRCILMAASLDQKLDPESVVRDCVARAGLTDELASVHVVDNLNRREVSATGVAPTNPVFLHLVGIDRFDAKGVSAASQGINNVEISLVLDVSGSMSGTKLSNLKVAAQDFIDTVTQGDDHKRISISIVPYNAQVNLGSDLLNQYNVQKKNKGNGQNPTLSNSYAQGSNCVEMPTSFYKSPGLTNQQPMNQTAHADFMYNTNYAYSYVSATDSTYALPRYDATYCRTTALNQIMLASNDAAALKSKVRGLEAGGNTSILMGMKWGVNLLDPDTRPMFQDLAAKGKMGSDLAVRPFDYGDRDTMKIVVLMTDGEHVSHTYIADDYKVGNSGIYLASDGKYSVYKANKAGTSKYWVPHLMSWAASAYKPTGGSVAEQDWSDIWAHLKVAYVSWQFYALPARNLGQDPSTAFNAAFNEMVRTNATPTAMNASLQDICSAAKDKKILVYGIAFEAPTNGQQQIRNCSTSDSHYFNAQGANIKSAFKSIASDITKLRLTQ